MNTLRYGSERKPSRKFIKAANRLRAKFDRERKYARFGDRRRAPVESLTGPMGKHAHKCVYSAFFSDLAWHVTREKKIINNQSKIMFFGGKKIEKKQMFPFGQYRYLILACISQTVYRGTLGFCGDHSTVPRNCFFQMLFFFYIHFFFSKTIQENYITHYAYTQQYG